MILRLFEESYRAFGTIDRPILEHWLCVQGHGLLGQGFEILRPRFQNFDVKALKSVKFSWKQWWVSFWPVLGARSEYFIRNLWKIFKFPDFFFWGGGGVAEFRNLVLGRICLLYRGCEQCFLTIFLIWFHYFWRRYRAAIVFTVVLKTNLENFKTILYFLSTNILDEFLEVFEELY